MKISNNIFNSKHNEIENKRRIDRASLSPPVEILNRHPQMIKKYLKACKTGRQESETLMLAQNPNQQSMIMAMQPYYELRTPSGTISEQKRIINEASSSNAGARSNTLRKNKLMLADQTVGRFESSHLIKTSIRENKKDYIMETPGDQYKNHHLIDQNKLDVELSKNPFKHLPEYVQLTTNQFSSDESESIDRSQPQIFNQRALIDSKNITKSGPQHFGSDRVQTSIFDLKDMNKVFNKQINKLTLTSMENSTQGSKSTRVTPNRSQAIHHSDQWKLQTPKKPQLAIPRNNSVVQSKLKNGLIILEQPIMKYQYRKDLLNTILANVDVGNFKNDEFYVPLQEVQGRTKEETKIFDTLQDRKDKMIGRYTQQVNKNWENLPFKIKSRKIQQTRYASPVDPGPKYPDAISFRPAELAPLSNTVDSQGVNSNTQRQNLPLATDHSLFREQQLTLQEEPSMFEEEDVDFLTRFLIEEQVQRDQYLITDDVQTIIDMMDSMIHSKKEASKKEGKNSKLPRIVQEVIQEHQFPNKVFPNCNCNVRAVMKDFVRYLRHYSNDLSGMKKKLKDQHASRAHICHHTLAEDIPENTKILMMSWFENFTEKLQHNQKNKVKKAHVFRRFVKLILQDFQPIFGELQNYIKKNNLIKGNLDFSSFHSYNQYMAMKIKKMDKLKKDQIQQFDLDESKDSSIESENSDDEEKQNFMIHHPEDKVSEIDFELSKKVLINKKMYNNFLGPIIGPENLEEPREDLRSTISKPEYEDAIVQSLNHTLKIFKKLKKIQDDKKQLKERIQKNKYMQSSASIELKNHNKNVDCVLEALQKNLEDSIDAKEKAKEKIKKKELEAQQSLKLQEEILSSGSPAKLNRQLTSTQTKEFPNLQFQISIKSKKKIKEDNIKIYDKELNTQQFYQKASKLITNPDDKCLIEHPIMMKYFQTCEQRKILPHPRFTTLIKNNILLIRDNVLSLEETFVLRDVILEGDKNLSADMAIHKVLIDDAKMDDEKISVVLDALQSQEGLRCITIMNCQMGMKSTKVLMNLLNKPYPNQVDELRLNNVRGLGDNKIDYCAEIVSLLATKNKIKVFQLSGMSLDNETIIQSLYDMIFSNLTLTELDISYAKITLQNFSIITQALCEKEIGNLQIVSLRGINKLYLNESIIAEEGSKVTYIRQIKENLSSYLEKSDCLQHIDLSCFEMGDKILDIVKAARYSTSLSSIHLSGNNLSNQGMKDVCEVMAIDIRQAGDKVQFMRNINEMENQDQMTQILRQDMQQKLRNKTVFDEDRQSQLSNYQAGKSQLTNMIDKQLKNNINESIKDLNHVRNTGHKGKKDITLCNELVLYRKMQHPELLFNDTIQNLEYSDIRHFDYSNGWNFRLCDMECYFCQKYPYTTIYFRKSDCSGFKEVTDDQERQYLLKDYAIDQLQDGDPFKRLPLIFGSPIEVGSSRMIMAKHQAAIMWARQESLKKASAESRERILRKYMKGIQQLMKNDSRKVDKEDMMEFNSFMVSWREYLKPEKGQSVINYPNWDEQNDDEDDVFMYAGYLKPGVHEIVIYEPSSEKFYKMQNMVLTPRIEEIDYPKVEPGSTETVEDEKREALQYNGTNFKFIKSFLFGNLQRDQSSQVANLAFQYDTDLRYFKPLIFMESIQKTYPSILKIWKLFQIKHYDCLKNQLSVTKQQFSNFIQNICSFEKISISDLDQTFIMVEKKNQFFSRRAFFKCVLRISQLISERDEKLISQFYAYNWLISECFEEYLSTEENNLKSLRKHYVYNNRFLCALFHKNAANLRKVFESLHDKNCEIQMPKGSEPYFKKKVNSFSLSQSLKYFQSIIEEISDFSVLNDQQVLRNLASQSQGTVLNEDLGFEGYDSLNFEEFLIFIVNCAVKTKRDQINHIIEEATATGNESKLGSVLDVKRGSGAVKSSLGNKKDSKQPPSQDTHPSNEELTTEDPTSPGLALGLIKKSASPMSLAVATEEFLDQFFTSLNKILSEKNSRANIHLIDQPQVVFVPYLLLLPDFDQIHLNSVSEISKSLRLPEKGLADADSQENLLIGASKVRKNKKDESSDYDSAYSA